MIYAAFKSKGKFCSEKFRDKDEEKLGCKF